MGAMPVGCTCRSSTARSAAFFGGIEVETVRAGDIRSAHRGDVRRAGGPTRRPARKPDHRPGRSADRDGRWFVRDHPTRLIQRPSRSDARCAARFPVCVDVPDGVVHRRCAAGGHDLRHRRSLGVALRSGESVARPGDRCVGALCDRVGTPMGSATRRGRGPRGSSGGLVATSAVSGGRRSPAAAGVCRRGGADGHGLRGAAAGLDPAGRAAGR